MTKRQPHSKKHKAQKKLNRYLIIGGVVLLAILVVVILILLSQPVKNDLIAVEAQTWPQADQKTMGNPEAPVVVREFSDFQCPYCKVFHDSVLPKLISDYVESGKIRFEYSHFIIIDTNIGGTESRRAAEASECANEQGEFWDYYNILFTNQKTEGSGVFSDDHLKTLAKMLGLDTTQFNSCLASGKYADQVAADEKLATSYGLNGTPSILVNDTVVQNPMDYTQLQTAIEAALK